MSNLISININYINKKLGIGDWGLGIGDWAPIPNPQINFLNFKFLKINFLN